MNKTTECINLVTLYTHEFISIFVTELTPTWVEYTIIDAHWIDTDEPTRHYNCHALRFPSIVEDIAWAYNNAPHGK